MERKSEVMFTVGELAQRVGVTVRTLQYYDKTGLLKSQSTEGGRRMYTRGDIVRLQQILFFKSFGFSLEEIEEQLLKADRIADLGYIFERQRGLLLRQAEHLQELVRLLDTAIDQIKTGAEVSLDKLMMILELMKQGNPYTFVVRYFNDEQLQNVSRRFDSPESALPFMSKAQGIFERMEQLYSEGADPEGAAGQKLARDWWNMVNDFTKGDPKLLQTLVSAGLDIGNWPKETKALQEAIANFLSKALTFYLNEKGIHLDKREADANV